MNVTDNMIFFGIIICVCISIFAVYKAYLKLVKIQKQEPVLVRNPISGKVPVAFDGKHIPALNNYSYCLSFWINLNDWNYKRNEWKNILYIGDENGNVVQPGIWITPKYNNLVVRFDTLNNKKALIAKKNKIYKSSTDDKVLDEMYTTLKPGLTLKKIKQISIEKNKEFSIMIEKGSELSDDTIVKTCIMKKSDIKNDRLVDASSVENMKDTLMYNDIYSYSFKNTVSLNPESKNAIKMDDGVSNHVKNIPLNRWTHIVVNVEEYSAEVYVDGVLSKTGILNNYIKENNGNLYLNQNNGFGGILTQLRFYPDSIKPSKIQTLSRMGPNALLFPPLVDFDKLKSFICDKKKSEFVEVESMDEAIEEEDDDPAKFSYPRN